MRKRELNELVALARVELLEALPADEVVASADLNLVQLARLVSGKLEDARRIWKGVNHQLGYATEALKAVGRLHRDEPEEW